LDRDQARRRSRVEELEMTGIPHPFTIVSYDEQRRQELLARVCRERQAAGVDRGTARRLPAVDAAALAIALAIALVFLVGVVSAWQAAGERSPGTDSRSGRTVSLMLAKHLLDPAAAHAAIAARL
jgi:hypothetical protein